MGIHVVQKEGEVFFGGVVPYFHNGKCYWVADRDMFPIRMQKRGNISVRQSSESSIRGLFGDVFIFKISIWVYEKLAKT